jgi:predicted phosphodiesterase
MRIAVIADIHGNILALEAVLAHLALRKPDLIVNLGDCASGPLWPRKTLDLLEALNAPTVRGNHDRWVAERDPAQMGPSDRFAFDEITNEQRRALGALPLRLHVAPGVLAFHATPTDDNLYLLEEIEDGRVLRGRPEGISERLGDVPAHLVLCGHSHRPDIVRLPGGTFILNPGSVGCPAYMDTNHVSESGSPHARYAMLERRDDGEFSLELIAVSYDSEAAARRAEANGRPEWAHGLRTGFMPRPAP